MSEKSGFFNGKLETDSYGYPKVHEDGSPIYDREYTAAEFADMFSIYLTNGVRNGGTNLKVMSGGDLNISVSPGDAMINGYFYRLLDSNKNFVLNKNVGSGERIDFVVLRLDLRQDIGRKISIELKEGGGLTRTKEILELCLAEISVPMGLSQISDTQIKDTRLNSGVCGLINSLAHVDTTLLFNQIDEYFKEKQREWKQTSSEYEGWFQSININWVGWFNKIKIELFSQQNTLFDDWSRQSGYKKEIVFLKNSSDVCYRIEEKLINSLNGSLHASRTTEFPGSNVKEILWYKEPALTVTRTTSFSNNKIIEEIL